MKNQLSDEVLTDYLFELLDSEKSKKSKLRYRIASKPKSD